MAGKGQTSSPSGRTPFDGLAPRDFFTEWPGGDVHPPAAFEAYPFAGDEPRETWLAGLELLRDLVLDYRAFVAENTREKVAKRTGLSTNTLSNFNNGVRFLKLGSYLALRSLLPDRREVGAREARRQALLDARWVERETQDRMRQEIQRQVKLQVATELRNRRPR